MLKYIISLKFHFLFTMVLVLSHWLELFCFFISIIINQPIWKCKEKHSGDSSLPSQKMNVFVIYVTYKPIELLATASYIMLQWTSKLALISPHSLLIIMSLVTKSTVNTHMPTT